MCKLEHASALIARAERNVQALRCYISCAESSAVGEVDLWRRMVDLCPHTCMPFKAELDRTPARPMGQELQQWLRLKRRIANIVRKAARETRRNNAAALQDPLFNFDWIDKDEGRLSEFASSSISLLHAPVDGRACGTEK